MVNHMGMPAPDKPLTQPEKLFYNLAQLADRVAGTSSNLAGHVDKIVGSPPATPANIVPTPPVENSVWDAYHRLEREVSFLQDTVRRLDTGN